jgi:oligoribonuclease
LSPIFKQTNIYLTKNMSTLSPNKSNIVWVDLEMTGLDVNTQTIIEMACIITDSNLNILAESTNMVIHHSDEVLSNMSEWCIKEFAKSGLTEESRKSKISLKEAEEQMVEFLKKYTLAKECPLAGNTVHMDKRFLDKYMQKFTDHLHYRIIDVSSIKELCMRWYPLEYQKKPEKKLLHRALDDIRESIDELKYYQKVIFK